MGAFVTALLLFFDPRTLSGEPLWLKPLKFFVSSGIYVATLEWIYSRSRFRVPPLIGSHFVGSAEGTTRVLGLTGWSLESGDLRVAHFFGMHAIQVLILLVLVLRRRGFDLHAPETIRHMRIFSVVLATGWGFLLMRSPKGLEIQ